MLSVVYARRNGAIVVTLAFLLMIMFMASELRMSDRVTRLDQAQLSTPAKDDAKPPEPQRPSILEEYRYKPPVSNLCVNRFSQKYIEDYRDHAISYCKPGSQSRLTCFHGSSRTDQKIDSMCIAQGVDFDIQEGKFDIDCSLRGATEEERNRGLINFEQIRPLWYNTGVRSVFKAAIKFRGSLDQDPHQTETRSLGSQVENAAASTSTVREVASARKFPRNYILLKRERENNTWHSMMEVFSSYLTIDVLRISHNQESKEEPFFRTPEDVQDTQVVIVDDQDDGPYLDSWTLFAKHKPIRLHELKQDPEAVQHIKSANIILPLAGGSNPMWQPEPEVRQCASAPTPAIFSNRILSLYGVPDPPPREPEDPIVVTFVHRETRRLLNQTTLVAELQERHPDAYVQIVDFAAMPFAEQLRVVRETDVLVGVHGAGLTHALFMRENVGAVVEILPPSLDHFGFRMVAAMRGLSYFQTHGEPDPVPSREPQHVGSRSVHSLESPNKDEWHWDHVQIEPSRFFGLMDVAIKSMYSRGVWDHSVN